MIGPRDDLGRTPVSALLARYAAILAELYARGVVRNRITPAGDLAELLVARATAGGLVRGGRRGWDVTTGDGRRLQVKCRVMQAEYRASETYSPFSSWDFDACVFVQLDADGYAVRRAVELPVDTVRGVSSTGPEGTGQRVPVGLDLAALPGALDRTRDLVAAMQVLDREARVRAAAQQMLPFDATEALVVAPRFDVEPTGWCFCGCGARVPDGRYFVAAHDRIAEAAVIHESYGSIAAFVAAHRPEVGSRPGDAGADRPVTDRPER